MKTILKKPAREGQNYVSPDLEVVSLQLEGSILFDSKNFTEGIGRDPYEDL